MLLTSNQRLTLLRMLEATAPEELDCSEVLHRVAGFVERFESGSAPPPGYDDVIAHLRICVECREEFEVLHGVLHSLESDRKD